MQRLARSGFERRSFFMKKCQVRLRVIHEGSMVIIDPFQSACLFHS